MSIRSLTDLAVKRDNTPVGKMVTSNEESRDMERTHDALISAIPSEVLALYTALTGGILASLITNDTDAYLPYRWALFAFAILLTPLSVAGAYRRKHSVIAAGSGNLPKARIPWAEMSVATLAAAAWFLSVPGSPLLSLLDTEVAALTSAAIVAGTTAILWAGFGRQLRTGTKPEREDLNGHPPAITNPDLAGPPRNTDPPLISPPEALAPRARSTE